MWPLAALSPACHSAFWRISALRQYCIPTHNSTKVEKHQIINEILLCMRTKNKELMLVPNKPPLASRWACCRCQTVNKARLCTSGCSCIAAWNNPQLRSLCPGHQLGTWTKEIKYSYIYRKINIFGEEVMENTLGCSLELLWFQWFCIAEPYLSCV